MGCWSYVLYSYRNNASGDIYITYLSFRVSTDMAPLYHGNKRTLIQTVIAELTIEIGEVDKDSWEKLQLSRFCFCDLMEFYLCIYFFTVTRPNKMQEKPVLATAVSRTLESGVRVLREASHMKRKFYKNFLKEKFYSWTTVVIEQSNKLFPTVAQIKLFIVSTTLMSVSRVKAPNTATGWLSLCPVL